jgi:hypothetical protein
MSPARNRQSRRRGERVFVPPMRARDRDRPAGIEQRHRRARTRSARRTRVHDALSIFARSHLFPVRVFGALPGAPTELKVRIDYPQHAGGAMLRYARLLQSRATAQ